MRISHYDVYIGRGSKWGNPFRMRNESDRDKVCDDYEEWFYTTDLPNHLHELRGKILGCYCKPKRCHGDFLVKITNQKYERVVKDHKGKEND